MENNFNIYKTNAQIRLLIAIPISFLIFLLLPDSHLLISRILIMWIVFSWVILLLSWLLFLKSHPREINVSSKRQDVNRVVILLFVIISATASLFGVIALLGSIKDLPKNELLNHAFIATLSVVSSWLLVQTTFAIRYARLYYDIKNQSNLKGLDFPNDDEPDYIDFAYFSFVIGMTFQVSDVEIKSRLIRRFCLLHAILSFCFNTVIIALTINTLSTII